MEEKRRPPPAVIGFILLVILIVLVGGGVFAYRALSGIPQEKAVEMAEEAIAERFPELAGGERVTGRYESEAGPFWTVTYHTRLQMGPLEIPKAVIISINRRTGEMVIATSR